MDPTLTTVTGTNVQVFFNICGDQGNQGAPDYKWGANGAGLTAAILVGPAMTNMTGASNSDSGAGANNLVILNRLVRFPRLTLQYLVSQYRPSLVS